MACGTGQGEGVCVTRQGGGMIECDRREKGESNMTTTREGNLALKLSVIYKLHTLYLSLLAILW